MDISTAKQFHLEKLKISCDAYKQSKRLTRTRYLGYLEARKITNAIRGKLIEHYLWLLKFMPSWKVIRKIGLDYENLIYVNRRKLVREKKLKKGPRGGNIKGYRDEL